MRSRLIRSIFLLAGVLAIGSCAEVPVRPTGAPVTEAAYKTRFETDRVLTVLPVSGAKEEQHDIWTISSPKVSNEELRGLLLGALRNAGRFGQVTESRVGDYSLNTEIICQEHVPGLTSIEMFLSAVRAR